MVERDFKFLQFLCHSENRMGQVESECLVSVTVVRTCVRSCVCGLWMPPPSKQIVRGKISVWAVMPLRPFAVLFGKRRTAETDRTGRHRWERDAERWPRKGKQDHSRECCSFLVRRRSGPSFRFFVLCYRNVLTELKIIVIISNLMRYLIEKNNINEKC